MHVGNVSIRSNQRHVLNHFEAAARSTNNLIVSSRTVDLNVMEKEVAGRRTACWCQSALNISKPSPWLGRIVDLYQSAKKLVIMEAGNLVSVQGYHFGFLGREAWI